MIYFFMTTTINDEQRLRQRIEERYKQGKLKEAYSIDPTTQQLRKYTPDEILEEIRFGTQKGQEFLQSEKKLEEELRKRL